MGQIETRLGSIARLIQTDQDATLLREHVSEVLESPAFSSSRRSGRFLQYIVEKAMAQQTDALKERVIGVEVFHRAPDYDTGEDAIVRVTASDVRRRLLQHYTAEGRASTFRISLPPGSYAPEIHRDAPVKGPAPRAQVPFRPAQTASITTEIPPTFAETVAAPPRRVPSPGRLRMPHLRWIWMPASCLLLAVVCFLAGRHVTAVQPTAPAPWSLLLAPGKPLLVVMADPDLNEIQALTGHYVSAADYAAGKLGCDTLRPDLQSVCQHNLRGDKSSTVDVAAIARVATLAGRYGSSVESLEARSLRLSDLQTDRNIVLFGSRTSNPWTDLYRDKLDFYVAQDTALDRKVVYDVRRQPGEPAVYVPTAGPWGSGDTYTIISFLRTLNGKGYALLLSGATHEGMDAAIHFALDPEQMRRARKGCGLRTEESPFQILLKLRMMAGSPLTVTSSLCHSLQSEP